MAATLRAGRQVVLLVDDEATLLGALERQFRLNGLHPLTAGSIARAWELLETSLVHCVVADEWIPDGSGAYFLVDVGRKFGGIGRVLLSGYVEPYLVEVGREHGFPVLDKGCEFRELIAAVRREIERDG